MPAIPTGLTGWRTIGSTAWSTPRRTIPNPCDLVGRAGGSGPCPGRAALRERGIRERDPHWGLIRLAFASPARVAMIQAQDALGLGSEARMNTPGRAGGNWRWRLPAGALTPALARRLRRVTDQAGRLAEGP